MIRVVTIDEFDEKQLKKFTQALYQAFGVGTVHAGQMPPPAGVSEPFDAQKLIEGMPKVSQFQDDKILFLTLRKLAERELPTGKAPTHGFALQGLDKAVVSMFPKKNLEDGFKFASRHSLHQVGHLWDLHHCLDPRCSMYPPWTPSFQTAEAIFCTFCREKSEQKIRLSKS